MPIPELVRFETETKGLPWIEIHRTEIEGDEKLIRPEGRIMELLLFDHVTFLHALEQALGGLGGGGKSGSMDQAALERLFGGPCRGDDSDGGGGGDDDDGDGINVGGMVGGIVGGLSGLIGGISGGLWYLKKKKKQRVQGAGPATV